MLQINNLIFFIILLAPTIGLGQVNHGFTYASSQSISPELIFELAEGKIMVYKTPYLSAEPTGLWLFNPDGQLLNTYNRTNTNLLMVHQVGSGFVLHATDSANFTGPYRCIILDQQLQQQQDFYPSKVNWPKSYFQNRSKTPQYRNGQIAYFGKFFDDPFDSVVVFGWLSYSENFDSLIADDLQFATDTQLVNSLFSWSDTVYFASAFTMAVNIPGFSGVRTTLLRKFNSAFEPVSQRNTLVPSSIPGFPRTIRTDRMINLAVNSHSIYGMSEFVAASPTDFDNNIHSFALYQFDHEFQLKRLNHQLAPTGRLVDVGFSSSRGVVFDQTQQYIYGIGAYSTPRPLNFNDQDRTSSLNIMKYDTALNMIWRREIEIPSTFFEIGALTPTSDGGLLVAVSRIDPSPNPNVRNLFVVKLDSAGNHSVSVPELATEKPQVQLYPNPTSGSVHLHWQQGQYQRFGLFNLKGQQVYHSELDAGSNLHHLTLPNLPAGLYFYQLTGPSGTVSGKLVKQ